LGVTQAGKGMIHVKDHHGANLAIAEAQIIGCRVNHYPLRPAKLLCRLLSLGKIAAADQQ
jgi:hypothetical protein